LPGLLGAEGPSVPVEEALDLAILLAPLRAMRGYRDRILPRPSHRWEMEGMPVFFARQLLTRAAACA